jgi:hypothetical protein
MSDPHTALAPIDSASITPPASLFAALAKAQGEMTGAARDRQNPHFKAMYATMASVVDAVRGPLSRAGLAYIQHVDVQGKTVSVETVLLHESGGTLRCGRLVAEAKDPGPQSIGSVLTYLRRYSLMAAVGIAPEDDDGEEGERPNERREEPRREEAKPAPAKPARTRDDVLRDLEALGLDLAAVDGWLTATGKAKVGDRDAANLTALVAALTPGKPAREAFGRWVIETAQQPTGAK